MEFNKSDGIVAMFTAILTTIQIGFVFLAKKCNRNKGTKSHKNSTLLTSIKWIKNKIFSNKCDHPYVVKVRTEISKKFA